MHRLALIALFIASPAWADAPAMTPPADGPIIRIVPKTLTGKVGDLIEIKAETSAKLVTWDVAGDQLDAKDAPKLLYPRPYDPAHKTVEFHASKDGVYAVVGSIPHGEETRVDVVIITIGQKPQPPPIDDKTDPTPKPPPTPPTEPVKYLVFIEETEEATASRGQFIGDRVLMDRLKSKGIRWRAADQNVKDGAGQVPRDLVPYLDRAKGKPLAQVFLVGASGKVLHQDKCPSTPAALIDLLAKFGG